MQYYTNEPPQFRVGFNNFRLTPGVKKLLIINMVVYFLQFFFSGWLIKWFALHPHDITHKFFIWQFVSYMFLHGGFWHIFFNMFMLWMFGTEVERSWGAREFLRFYLVCGIGAGLFHLLLQPASVVGASGAIYGVLIAFVMLYPDRRLLFFPFPFLLKAKYWALIFVGISLMMGLLAVDQVAHFAHLGGMLIGFLYIKFGWRLYLGNFFNKKKSELKSQKDERQRQQTITLLKKVDQILDKINEVGYENLTDRELRTLKDASDLLSKINEDQHN
ncbi:MAG: rhomboid family intramembrane serine protease [bacterium]|nr:rhomboid family intramembrane serine protease [bacterium]